MRSCSRSASPRRSARWASRGRERSRASRASCLEARVDDQAAALAVIRRVVNGELGLSCAVRPQDDLVLDLHLDSVGLLTLVVELEDAFRVAIPAEGGESE